MHFNEDQTRAGPCPQQEGKKENAKVTKHANKAYLPYLSPSFNTLLPNVDHFFI